MKEKNILDKLEKSKADKETRGRGLIAVIACKEDINIALEAGYNLKRIHTILVNENKMPIEYTMFRRHVNKLILNQENKTKDTPLSPEKITPVSATKDQPKKVKKTPTEKIKEGSEITPSTEKFDSSKRRGIRKPINFNADSSKK